MVLFTTYWNMFAVRYTYFRTAGDSGYQQREAVG